MRQHSRLAAAALVAFISMLGTVGAQTGAKQSRVDLFVTFGDSLADTGNLYIMTRLLRQVPAIPPSDSPHRTYFEGRFSNGRVGFERLWDRMRGSAAPLRPFLSLGYVPSKGAVDFAFGGSGSDRLGQTPGGLYVPGLLGQVDLFATLRLGRLPARTVAAIVTGSNDYLTTPPALPANPVDVVGNIIKAVERLHNRGVSTVMVVNIPDLGAVPLVAGLDAEARNGLSGLALAHNELLAARLAALALQRPSLTIIPIDVAEVIDPLREQGINETVPAIAAILGPGADPAAAACLFVNPASCVDVPTFNVGPGFFYWDVLHPTATVHKALGDYMCTRLDGCQ